MSKENSITKLTKTQNEIVSEIGTATANLGAPSGLMSIIMSWGDTMNDKETLQALKDWNAKKFAKANKLLQHQ